MKIHINNKNIKGFTLLEIILVLILLGILSLISGRELLQMVDGAIFTEKNVQSVIDSDRLKTLSIRLSRIYSITQINNSSSFKYTDLNSDGSQSSAKIMTAPTGIEFQYFNAAGSATNIPGQVRLISISLNATVGDDSVKTYSLRVAPYHLNYS